MGRFRLIVLFVCLALGMSSRVAWSQAGSAPSTTERRPVQESRERTTPVVHPHGPLHPRKPPHRPEHVAAKPTHPEKQETAAKPPPANPQPPPPAAPAAPPPVAAATPPAAAPAAEDSKPGAPKPNVPRFASLRFDDVNMRRGPGPRYPIEWVYKRRDLPVQIEREFDIWRLIRDPDGIRGWVSEASLTGRRSFIVTGADATMRREPSETAAAVAILKPGVIGRIRSCEAGSDWCRVQSGDYAGYLKRTAFWGTDPGEAVNP